jgi:hypothetical protein
MMTMMSSTPPPIYIASSCVGYPIKTALTGAYVTSSRRRRQTFRPAPRRRLGHNRTTQHRR